MSIKIKWEQGTIKEAYVSIRDIRISESGRVSTHGGSNIEILGYAVGIQYIISTDSEGQNVISRGEMVLPLGAVDTEIIIGKVESILSSKKELLETR